MSAHSLLKQDLDAGRNLLIHTDAEPDDVLALEILAAWLKKNGRLLDIMFTVGERDADKAEMIAGICEMTGLRYRAVTQVDKTDEVFPRELLGVFPPRLEEYVDGVFVPLPIPSLTPEEMLCEPCTIVCIAPPRWLIRRFLEGEDMSKHRLYMYGSFNYRTLLQSGAVDIETMTRFLGAFDRTLVYENRSAIGRDNNSTPDKDPDFFAVISEETQECMEHWTRPLLERQRAKLERIPADTDDPKDRAARSRAQKLVDSVGPSGKQVVLADVGLMVTLLETDGGWIRRGNIVCAPETFYPSFEADEAGRILYVEGMGREFLIEEATRILSKRVRGDLTKAARMRRRPIRSDLTKAAR